MSNAFAFLNFRAGDNFLHGKAVKDGDDIKIKGYASRLNLTLIENQRRN